MGILALACGDPGFSELVINHANHSFVLRYEPRVPSDETIAFTVPAGASGSTLGGMGTWRGVVAVLTADCVPLGRIEVTADSTLLIFAADGTFSFTTDHVYDRTDINPDGRFLQTRDCPR